MGRLIHVSAFLLLGVPSISWGLGMDDFEMHHMLSVGGGISSPSVTSALGENPAGLSNNHQTKFLAAAGATDPSINPLGLAGLFFLGNGFVGGGLGVQTFNGRGNNAGNITVFNFGIAADIQSLNISLGATGSYTLIRSGLTSASGVGTGSNWGTDIGIIYNPKGAVRVGVTAFQILDPTIGAFGAGVAADANNWATIAVDGAISRQGQGKTIKPALGIHLLDFQFTLGYGIALDSSTNTGIPAGGSFGIGFRFNQTFHLQGYYNQLALYYLGLSVRL